MVPCIMLNLVFEEPYSLPCKFFSINIHKISMYSLYPNFHWYCCFLLNAHTPQTISKMACLFLREWLQGISALSAHCLYLSWWSPSFFLPRCDHLSETPTYDTVNILDDPKGSSSSSNSFKQSVKRCNWTILDFPYPPGRAYHCPNSHSDCTKMNEKGYKDLTLSYHHILLRFFTETSQVQTSNYMEIFG